jgi:hypothetical protein
VTHRHHDDDDYLHQTDDYVTPSRELVVELVKVIDTDKGVVGF